MSSDSDRFSPAVEASISDWSAPDSASCGPANPTDTREPCSESDSPESRSTRTCESSEPTLQPSTRSPAASPAKTSPSPAEEPAWTERAPDSGASTHASFASWDHNSQSWRTSQLSLLVGSDEFSETWPKSGSMLAGQAFAHPTLELLTDASGYSSSPLLPTPEAHDDGKTPEAHLAMKARMPGSPRYTITSLAVLARADFQQPPRLLPTPNADDTRPASQTPAADGRKRQARLSDALRLLPTPLSSDGNGPKRSRTRQGGGNLTEALRGAPTSLPSDDGSECAAFSLLLPSMETDA